MSETLPKYLSEKIDNKNYYNTSENFDKEWQVYCLSYHPLSKWSDAEVASDFTVYPCCNLHAIHQIHKVYFDEYLDSLEPDWNNLLKNSMDDILSKYYDYLIPDKWRNENTVPNCCNNCKLNRP